MAGMNAKMTTLCYLLRDDRVLMLHRVIKKNDENRDKWIGLGGHFEPGESPEDCLCREVREEAGLRLTRYAFRGIITFVIGDPLGGGHTEYMHLYTADGFEPDGTFPLTAEGLPDCPEGVLAWIGRTELEALPMWAGDRIFLRLLWQDAPFFSLKLCYDPEGNLLEAVLDGEKLDPGAWM